MQKRLNKRHLCSDLGEITGGAFNPAVALGISVIGMTSWCNITAFLLGQLLAGVAAAFVFKYVAVSLKTKEDNK